MFDEKTLARFWAKVQKTDTCWLWTAGKVTDGYGAFAITHSVQRKAHRISWEMAHGPISTGLCVLHKCDNPPCVNPDHLFLGTNDENMADMVAKGRAPQGERNNHAVLTVADVHSIRELFLSGMPKRAIARKYNMTHNNIRFIVTGVSWRHV